MQTAPDLDPPPSGRLLCSPEKLYGWAVEDRSGGLMGTVNDLLMDMAAGRIAYVIVATGGFFGMGEARFPLAWEAQQRAHDGSARFIWNGQGPRGRGLPARARRH